MVRLVRVQMALAHLTPLRTLHCQVLVVIGISTPMLVVRHLAQDAQLDVGAALARPPLAHPTYRLPARRRPWPLALAMVFVL